MAPSSLNGRRSDWFRGHASGGLSPYGGRREAFFSRLAASGPLRAGGRPTLAEAAGSGYHLPQVWQEHASSTGSLL